LQLGAGQAGLQLGAGGQAGLQQGAGAGAAQHTAGAGSGQHTAGAGAGAGQQGAGAATTTGAGAGQHGAGAGAGAGQQGAGAATTTGAGAGQHGAGAGAGQGAGAGGGQTGPQEGFLLQLCVFAAHDEPLNNLQLPRSLFRGAGAQEFAQGLHEDAQELLPPKRRLKSWASAELAERNMLKTISEQRTRLIAGSPNQES